MSDPDPSTREARDAPPTSSSSPAAGSSRPRLGRNIYVLAVVSFFTDVSSEMIYPLLPAFLTVTLHASASFVGAIEGAAETTAALLKLASGWFSDRSRKRKPLVVIGYTIASVMRPLVAIAQSAAEVLAVRVTDRIGKGIRNSPRDALIADSVDPAIRGRAFGFHRGADHAGGVVGPLVAFALLHWWHVPLRAVFWLAAIPGAISVVALVVGVREPRRPAPPERRPAANADSRAPAPLDLSQPMGKRFWMFMAVIFVFTLGNSTDAFLLLRAQQLGVPVAMMPILWAFLHVVKSGSSVPGGMLSDRAGRRPALVAGWSIYAAVYFAFGEASATWHAWALFAAYGVFFGLTEGSERALVADLVPLERRGTAFGWYNLAIGLGALPASVIFGRIWDAAGSRAAFLFGASLAVAAAAGIMLVRVRPATQQQREPGVE